MEKIKKKRLIVKYDLSTRKRRIGGGTGTLPMFIEIKKSFLIKNNATHIYIQNTADKDFDTKIIEVDDLEKHPFIYPVVLGSLLGINTEKEIFNRVTKDQEGWLIDTTQLIHNRYAGLASTPISTSLVEIFDVPSTYHEFTIHKRDLITYLEMLCFIEKTRGPQPFYAWVSTTSVKTMKSQNSISTIQTIYAIIEELFLYFSEISEKATRWFLSYVKKLFFYLVDEIAITDKSRVEILNAEKKLTLMLNTNVVEDVKHASHLLQMTSITPLKIKGDSFVFPVHECLYLLVDDRCIVENGFATIKIESLLKYRIPDLHYKLLTKHLFSLNSTCSSIDTLAVITAYYNFRILGKRQETAGYMHTIQRYSGGGGDGGGDDDSNKLVQVFNNTPMIMPRCLLNVDTNFKTIGHLKNEDRMVIVGTLHSMGYSASAITTWFRDRFVNDGDIEERSFDHNYKSIAANIIKDAESKNITRGHWCSSMMPGKETKSRIFVCPFYKKEDLAISDIENLDNIKISRRNAMKCCEKDLIEKLPSSLDAGVVHIIKPIQYSALYIEHVRKNPQ